jgi:hypothetical protein
MSMSLSIREIYVLENGNRKRTGDREFEQVREMESASSGVVTLDIVLCNHGTSRMIGSEKLFEEANIEL